MTDDHSPHTGAQDRSRETDEPSRAELQDEDGNRQRGFLARLLGFSSSGETDEESPPETVESVSELALMRNIRTMRGQRVDDIMIPRADIAAIEATASLEELTAAFREGAHSRLPVYRETLDDPIGFIHVKDVALARGFAPESGVDASPLPDFRIEDYIRQMLVVPPSMLTARLMQRMQQQQIIWLSWWMNMAVLMASSP